MAMDKKALLKKIKTVGMAVIALAAVAVFLFTAADLAFAPNATTSFFRTSVWRMVSCACIAVIFPVLIFDEKRKERRNRIND